MSFTGFNVGETFIWSIDVDEDGSDLVLTQVVANELIGATALIDFSHPAALSLLVVGVGVLGLVRRTRA